MLAVRIEKNATPGSIKEKTFQSPGLNGGALGADNPTYHATIGWDWIPPIRGRDTGIWGGVYLTATGPVTIENPLVTTTLPLPDTSRADVAIEATRAQSGVGARARNAARTFRRCRVRHAGSAGAVRIEDGPRRSHHACRAPPDESETVVAGRLWRSESLSAWS